MYVLKKAGLVFDEKKIVSALKKSGLKLIAIIEAKKINVKVKRSKICDELEAGMVQQAEIEVEQVIRDDLMIKAFDTLRCECYRVEDRISAVASSKRCPSDLEQAICTVIWATDRIEIPELHTVKVILTKKYGKEFAKRAVEDEDGCVNPKITEKFRYQHNSPPENLKEEYLVNIAKSANVDFRPSGKPDKAKPQSSSPSSSTNKLTGISAAALAKRYYSSARPAPTHDSPKPKRLGDSPKSGEEASRRSHKNVDPVVIAYLTL